MDTTTAAAPQTREDHIVTGSRYARVGPHHLAVRGVFEYDERGALVGCDLRVSDPSGRSGLAGTVEWALGEAVHSTGDLDPRSAAAVVDRVAGTMQPGKL